MVSIFSWIFLIGIYGLSKIWFRLFIVLHIIVFIPYFITNEMLHGVSNSHITALYFTNTSESLSYLKVIPTQYIILAAITTVPFLYFFAAPFPVFNKKRSWILLGFTFFYSMIKLSLSFPVLKDRMEYSYKLIYISPIRTIVKIAGMYDIVKRDIDVQRKLQKIPDTWEIKNTNPKEDLYIIVLGESVRRDFVEIYNPQFKNSSFLKSVPKIQFNNALSFAGTTMESLSKTLVMEDEKGKTFFPNNVVSLAQKANFEVEWISNQGSIGSQDNLIAAMAKNANFNQFITKGIGATFQSDDKLIDIFKERIIAPTEKKKVIFLHLIGSHPAPCDITNGKYEDYIISTDISCYNETIRRTDNFLKNIYEIAKESNKNFSIVYFADHGLFLDSSKTLYHGTQYKQNYEVPLVIINPKIKETVYINEYRNLNDFLYLYTDLLHIQTSNLHPGYKFISEDKSNGAFILDNNLNYKNLKNNPAPK